MIFRERDSFLMLFYNNYVIFIERNIAMKRFLFLITLSLCFTLSCKSNSDSDELRETVITEEECGPYGDTEFCEIIDKIVSGGKPSALNNSKGKKYYISPDADSNGNGSLGDPFNTFSAALKKLSAGDTLYVKGGTYDEQIKLTSVLKGNADAYITITSYDSDKPVIVKGDEAEDDFMLMTIKGASYVRISGLTFANSDGQDAAGIYIGASSNHIIIDNCTFRNITVPEPAVEDHVANGILAFGNGSTVDKSINNLLFYNNSFNELATGWGECISVVGNCEFVNIIKNTLDRTGNIGIDVGGNYGYCPDPELDFTRYAYIARNTVKNCESAYGDTAYGIYSDGGQHIQIEKNTVINCSGGIEVGAEEPQKSEAYATFDVLIKNNNVSESVDCALAIGGYKENLGLVRSVKVTGNKFTDNADKEDGAIVTLSKCDNVIITKNTFTQSNGNYKGEVLYKQKLKHYPKNITIKDNSYKGLESVDD